MKMLETVSKTAVFAVIVILLNIKVGIIGSMIPIMIILNSTRRSGMFTISLWGITVWVSGGEKPIEIALAIAVLAIAYLKIKKGEKDALIDPLTGSLNRKYFDSFLKESKGFKKSLMLIDIDFFKNINDTYGHDCGDFILKEMITVIRGEIRKEDKLVRFGGEEFAILTRNDKEEMNLLAERIRQRIQRTPFLYNGETINITVSIGCVENATNLRYSCGKTLYKAADKALYKAKETGRNRVSFAS